MHVNHHKIQEMCVRKYIFRSRYVLVNQYHTKSAIFFSSKNQHDYNVILTV